MRASATFEPSRRTAAATLTSAKSKLWRSRNSRYVLLRVRVDGSRCTERITSPLRNTVSPILPLRGWRYNSSTLNMRPPSGCTQLTFAPSAIKGGARLLGWAHAQRSWLKIAL